MFPTNEKSAKQFETESILVFQILEKVRAQDSIRRSAYLQLSMERQRHGCLYRVIMKEFMASKSGPNWVTR